MKVLIIEDDRFMQERFRRQLGGRFELSQAYTLHEAEAFLRDGVRQYAAICVDGCLSGDDFDTGSLIRFISMNFPGPVIAISSNHTLRQSMLQLGCTHECEKRFLPGNLIRILEETKKPA